MKQVGEALQDFIMSSTYKGEIVAIGIASWGTVHNRNSLICRTVSQKDFQTMLLEELLVIHSTTAYGFILEKRMLEVDWDER